jgi:hypothetical protein
VYCLRLIFSRGGRSRFEIQTPSDRLRCRSPKCRSVVASAVILAFILLFAFVRIPKAGFEQNAVAMCAVLFLSMMLCTSFIECLHYMKREKGTGGPVTGAYDRATFSAGESLAKAQGIHPGDTIACLGEMACRNDSYYWARLARVSIRTEIFADQGAPLRVWQDTDQTMALDALRSTGAKAIVSYFGDDGTPSGEWQRLGSSRYFLLYL